MFGALVEPAQIIGETLRRATPEPDSSDPAYLGGLQAAVAQGDQIEPPSDYHAFVQHPLSSWVESTFGLRQQDGRLIRSSPRAIRGEGGAAHGLSILIHTDEDICARVLQRWLLAGYESDPNPETGFHPFAFRLHQFLSPGDTAFTTIESEDRRYITLNGQQFVPHDRSRVLFPLCFCRECGQEYYVVRVITEQEHQTVIPREFRDQLDDENSEAGYLYLNTLKPWSDDFDDILTRVPEDWLEERNGLPRIKANRRAQLPRLVRVRADGDQDSEGQECAYLPAPFLFCLNCGVSYAPRQSEFGKLASLSSEGRSSATTILSLSAIRSLKTSDLPVEARKLLSFTDNRQDASLQAGHFNDFVEVGLMRGAIYRAVQLAGAEGLRHDVIAQKVFDALGLPLELYATDPQVRYQALQETQKAPTPNPGVPHLPGLKAGMARHIAQPGTVWSARNRLRVA